MPLLPAWETEAGREASAAVLRLLLLAKRSHFAADPAELHSIAAPKTKS